MKQWVHNHQSLKNSIRVSHSWKWMLLYCWAQRTFSIIQTQTEHRFTNTCLLVMFILLFFHWFCKLILPLLCIIRLLYPLGGTALWLSHWLLSMLWGFSAYLKTEERFCLQTAKWKIFLHWNFVFTHAYCFRIKIKRNKRGLQSCNDDTYLFSVIFIEHRKDETYHQQRYSFELVINLISCLPLL